MRFNMASILINREGRVGHLTLNRPEALNALTLEMVRSLVGALRSWEKDAAVELIVIDGAGDRAFCAGGDIRALWESGKACDGHAEAFWREEYHLNATIARYPKPIVGIMSGITMGGGVGLGAHASHRVVTETTMLAMPEVGIGFVPDVGGTWLLSHAPGELGTFVGLTAFRLSAADAIACGMADAYLPRQKLADFHVACGTRDFGDVPIEAVGRCLRWYREDPPAGRLALHRRWMTKVSAKVPLRRSLKASRHTTMTAPGRPVQELLKQSPTSLKVTVQALRRARQCQAWRCVSIRSSAWCAVVLKSHDFYEGIRAAVIDKDRSPQWKPASLDAVNDQAVESYFQTPGGSGASTGCIGQEEL
jgi:enoyl-CoA hydratase